MEEPKIMKNAEIGGIGMKIGGKISGSLRYVIYIIGTDPLYWEGGGLILKN